MSVQELNRVHRRYIETSNGFKSAWTFHQFIQGLRKVFADEGPPEYPADFQSVYGSLKQVSHNLAEETAEEANRQLDEVESSLAPLVQSLLAADEQVSPALLRRFFQRVKNYDDNILSQLVKFYLYFRNPQGWNTQRLDKADFLTTKVSEEYRDGRDAFVPRDQGHLREVAQGFWAALGATPVDEDQVAALCQELASFRETISAVGSMDELDELNLVPRYREFKHGLGDVFFQPKVLMAIVETNLVLKNQTQQLYRQEEQRIIAEYQQVFELERDVPVDVQLKGELEQFREVVDQFESRLQVQNVRLEELSTLRKKVRELLPKLQPAEEVGPGPGPAPGVAAGKALGAPQPLAGLDYAYVDGTYAELVAALDDTDAMTDPKRVAYRPELFSFGIEPREVVAYRRLYTDAPCDRSLEEHLLRTAALRVRIEREVEEIKGILDDTAVTREAPIFAIARTTVRKADLAARSIEHLIDQAILNGDAADAQALQVLRMRMLRAYAGLWLMVNKS